MSRRGFTLIEMLLATVLAAVLMTAVLLALSGLSRDRAAMAAADPHHIRGAADLIEWDLRYAHTATAGAEDVVVELVGNNGIVRGTLTPDGRLVRVTYRRAGNALWRQQEYLDDPARPERWQEQAAGDFRTLSLQPPPGDFATVLPARLSFDLATEKEAERREVLR